MAKEKPISKDERKKEKKEKKDKKEKKEKRSDKDGVHKSKKDKKEKKIVKAAEEDHVVTALFNNIESEIPGSIAKKENEEIKITLKHAPLLGALVPFANPLADEKVGKKVLKSVKKGQSVSWSGSCSSLHSIFLRDDIFAFSLDR